MNNPVYQVWEITSLSEGEEPVPMFLILESESYGQAYQKHYTHPQPTAIHIKLDK